MSGRSTCPECGTILRIRDRSFVGRKVNCPECKIGLRIEASERDDTFFFRRLTAADIAIADQSKRRQRETSSQSNASPATTRSLFLRVVSSPMTAICLVAIAVISLFAVLWLNPRLRFSSNPSVSVRKVTDSSDLPVQISSPALTATMENPVSPDTGIARQAEMELAPEISALEPENTDLPLTFVPVTSENAFVEPAEPLAPNPVPLAKKTAKIDVESKMTQKILLYRQPKVSRRMLIDALQEQLGVPIRYNVDELGETSLGEQVTFELENTTLGAIMKLVADTAGWRIVLEDTGIRLTKKE